MTLAPHHLEFLAARAVSPEVAELRGYRTIDHPADLVLAGGFPPEQARRLGTGLLIPRYGLDGRPSWAKFRPDGKRYRNDGTPIKYASPACSWNLLDVLPDRRFELLTDCDIWLSAEGFVKSDAMTSAGVSPVLAIDGVWGWRSKDGPLPALEVLARQKRWWHLVADSDFASSDDVPRAVVRLGQHLKALGGRVRILHPPGGDQKVGVDDMLAAGGSLDDLVFVKPAEVRRFLDPSPGGARRFSYSPRLTGEA